MILRERIFIQLLLVPAILVCSLAGWAQSPLFRQYELRESRLKPRILCMANDRQGLLWLGTEDGLFYFNGLEFKRPYLADSVKNLSVTALAQDRQGHMWAGTDKGIILRLHHYQQEAFVPEEGFPKVAISGIVEERDGTLFFSTHGEGIYYWNGKRLYNVDTDDGLSDNYCYSLVLGPGNGVIAGTDNGISHVTVRDSTKKINVIGRAEGLTDDIVRVICPVKGGYWIGFQEGGVLFLDLRLKTLSRTTGYPAGIPSQVNSLCALGEELWVGTETAGIQRLPFKGIGSTGDPTTLESTGSWRVTGMLRDPAGNVWIASGNKLIRCTGENLRVLNQAGKHALHHIHCILNTSDGRIWFSPDQQLYSIHPLGSDLRLHRYEITSPERLTDIVTLYEDPSAGIWAGTLGEGVFRLDPGSGKVRQVTEIPELQNASILSITGRGEDLWVTGFGGVNHLKLAFHDGKVEYASVPEPALEILTGIYIYSSHLDRQGALWLGSDEHGLYRYANGSLKQYTQAAGLPGNSVLGICEDAAGVLWVNCIDGGVAALRQDSLHAYGISDGLTDLSLSAILALPDTSLLVVHANGLDRFDPATGTFSPFRPDELMNDLNPDPNTLCLDQAGNVWLGTEKGLLVLEPPNPGDRPFPPTALEHIIQYPDPVNFWERRRFAYDENNFRFEFSGIWYADPGRVQYAIQLEGLSDKWQFSHEPAAWFSNLAPGSYTFRVRTSLNNRFLRSPEYIYHFVVEPPFWKTWWFRILLATGIVGGIWWFVQRRERQLREIERYEKERIMFQLETLRSQVNPHFLFNSFNTLLNLIEKDPKKAAEYTEQLSDFFRDIISNRDLPQVRLEDELKLLSNYIAIQKKRYGDNLNVRIEVEPEHARAFLIPPMTLQLLAENAIKHNVVSRDLPLNLSIALAGNSLCVTNNLQPRLQHEPSTGLGLENIKRRFSLMIEEPVRIEQTAHEFRVCLPLQRINPS